MKFSDCSPPTSPSPAQQWDALRKGLGRALRWASNGHLDDAPLLEACLRDQRFDAQVENPRGDWLQQIIRAVRATERFRVPILHALYDLSEDRSANQLCELACHYAEAGDETFHTRLYEIVERKPFPHSHWLAEQQIVDLDGEQGFLFAARVRGRLLASREWQWDDGNLIDIASERFGEEQVRGILEASSDEAISRFRESWQRERQSKAEGCTQDTADLLVQSHRERMTAIPVEEVIRAAENAEGGCLRGWGRYADQADLQVVLQRLWATREPGIIATLLRVFSARALPEFDARLIGLCRHSHDEVRRRAFGALEPNTHPLVREFALTELRNGVQEGSVVALFTNNYQPGDEQRILEAMELPDDECELHWLLMDVFKVLEKNPEADCSRLGVIGYTFTPCENCRLDAVRLLLSQQVLPKWLREECLSDSNKECRELVEKATNLSFHRGEYD